MSIATARLREDHGLGRSDAAVAFRLVPSVTCRERGYDSLPDALPVIKDREGFFLPLVEMPHVDLVMRCRCPLLRVVVDKYPREIKVFFFVAVGNADEVFAL